MKFYTSVIESDLCLVVKHGLAYIIIFKFIDLTNKLKGKINKSR